MSNPSDKDFPNDSELDDIFTSHDDPMNETGIQDAVEDSSSIDDISDYDDSEDGIFAPAPEKKKASSSALLGTVAVVALLSAGGFYFYKNPDILESFQSTDTALVIPTAVIPQTLESVEVSVQASSEAPAVVEVPQVQDAELENIPQPQPIANIEDTSIQEGDSQTAAATLEQSEPVVEAEATVIPETTIASVDPVVPPAAPEPEIPTADMPAPPSPEETKLVVVPVTESVAESVTAPVIEPVVDPAPAPVVTAAPEVVSVTPPPPEKVLAAVPKAPVKPAPVAEAPAPMTKPAVKAPETVYFDAPKGKALTDIPTPSMKTARGKDESIMIVGKRTSAEISASSGQEAGVAAATRALKLGRYEASLEMFNDLYRANQRDVRILMGRAISLQRLGRPAEAIMAYEDVLAMDRNNPEALVNLMGLVRKEYPAQALEKLLTLKSRHPDNANIIAQLGIAYADSGNLEDAASNLMLASRMEPKNPQHYFNLGIVAERMKNRTRAIAYYEKALETDAVYGTGRGINRDMIYDRLTRLRG
jgi:Flp pilus assembly protein TadD